MLAPGVSSVGEQLFPGQVVDVDEATVAALRADGKASLVADEEAAAERAKEGNFSARTSREAPPPPKEKK